MTPLGPQPLTTTAQRFTRQSPEQLAAAHVGHAMRQVLELDDLARGRTEATPLVWNAALEAQLVNVRMILDFLADADPSRTDDVTAHDFVPAWTGVTGDELRQRLHDYRGVVNKHIAHLTWTRVTSLTEKELNLDHMAEDVRTAYRQFAAQVRDHKPDLVGLLTLGETL